MRLGLGEAAVDDLVAVSESIKQYLVAAPTHSSQGTCSRCRTWKFPTQDAECDNCAEVHVALGTGAVHISVVSLYEKPSQLRDWLTRYKGRDDEIDGFDADAVPIVRAVLGRFILEHGDELERVCGGVDAIAVVPSTHRQPPHPLEEILRSLRIDVPVMPLLQRGTGELGFRKPAVDGYDAAAGERPLRVLLIDDVYTTGSRINSAAAALRSAGHAVPAALVLARRVNPDYTPEAREFWDRAVAEVFDWTAGPVCCPA